MPVRWKHSSASQSIRSYTISGLTYRRINCGRTRAHGFASEFFLCLKRPLNFYRKAECNSNLYRLRPKSCKAHLAWYGSNFYQRSGLRQTCCRLHRPKGAYHFIGRATCTSSSGTFRFVLTLAIISTRSSRRTCDQFSSSFNLAPIVSPAKSVNSYVSQQRCLVKRPLR